MPETCGHVVYHCNSGQTRFRSKAESKWISGFVFEVSWTWLTWQPYSRCSANNSRSFDSIQENLCKPVLNMSMMTCAEPFVFNSLFLKPNHAWCKKNMQHSNMHYPPIITRSLYILLSLTIPVLCHEFPNIWFLILHATALGRRNGTTAALGGWGRSSHIH